jgi:hypothetical protein
MAPSLSLQLVFPACDCRIVFIQYLFPQSSNHFHNTFLHGQLQLTGRNLGRVFNSRLGHACMCCAIAYIIKQPNLNLKNGARQLLGSLPLAFALSGQT